LTLTQATADLSQMSASPWFENVSEFVKRFCPIPIEESFSWRENFLSANFGRKEMWIFVRISKDFLFFGVLATENCVGNVKLHFGV